MSSAESSVASSEAGVGPGERILVTGATGAVGHYLVEALIRDTTHHLVLLVRDPSRLRLTIPTGDRVRILVGDLREPGAHDAALRQCTGAVLAAAAWEDGPSSHRVNVESTLALLETLRDSACRRVVYFSTASILDHEGQLLPEAESLGTPYVRSKFRMRQLLDKRTDLPPITIVYPTLVLAGDATHPSSHVANLLAELVRRKQLLRWFSVDACVHFTHAADIASVVCALLDTDPAVLPRDVILGGAATPVNDAVDALLAHEGMRRAARIPLTAALARAFIAIFRVQLAPWDRFCLEKRHFTYRNTAGPRTFGREERYGDLREAFASILTR